MMRRRFVIVLFSLLALASCTGPTREARRMARRAELLFDTLPDSAARLIDSVLRIPVQLGEGRRMGLALMQGEALFGDRGDRELSPLMDDDFDERAFRTASPELERAAAYYARKRQYDRAAHAALYSGFVQQHYGEKQVAMQSFKDAEQYAKAANDSLTAAMAKCQMGKLLYADHMYAEALSMFESAVDGWGSHQAEKAVVHNMMAVCCLLQSDHESAEDFLRQSLAYAEQCHADKVKSKILNNYAVLYRLQGKLEQSIGLLRQMGSEPNLTDVERTLFYLNMGNAFSAFGKTDSAASYYRKMEDFLPTVEVSNETKFSVYTALSGFAKSQNDNSLALQYQEKRSDFMYEIMRSQQNQNVYRIQQQYDYEGLQDRMNRKVIRRQRLIIVLSAVMALVLLAFVLSQIRLARFRRQEAEIKDSLLHFMQQNEELRRRHEESSSRSTDYSQRMSEMLAARLQAMLKLDSALQNQGDKSRLRELEKDLFGDKGHLESWK